jgi:hypothetical protein
MALDTKALVSAMATAGQGLGAAVWNDIQTYAIPEFEKIAVQIAAIEANAASPNPYPPDAAKALMDMQVRASVGVIVGMTALTLLAIQSAINQILQAIKTAVNTALQFALIA